MIFRADLVPVFSFGENDVSTFGHCLEDAKATIDLRANAKREGNGLVQRTKAFSAYIWVYATHVPRTRYPKLFVPSLAR
jgi:hypothetical protein